MTSTISPSLTVSPTGSASQTISDSQSISQTWSPSVTRTITASLTPSASLTASQTMTMTRSQSGSGTRSASQSATASGTQSVSPSATVTSSLTCTTSASSSQATTRTQTGSQSRSASLSDTLSARAMQTPSASSSHSLTASFSQVGTSSQLSTQSQAYTSIPSSPTSTPSGTTSPTTTQSVSPSVSVRSYALALSTPSALLHTAFLSDSTPSLTLSMGLDRCPDALSLIVTCTTMASEGVSLFYEVSPSRMTLACEAASASASILLPVSMGMGACYGTAPGSVQASCQVKDAITSESLAFASSPEIAVKSTVWPVWADALLVSETGTVRSWLFGTTVDAAPLLLSMLRSSPACTSPPRNRTISGTGDIDVGAGVNCSSLTSALALPEVVLGAVQRFWGNYSIRNASFSSSWGVDSDTFTLTLTSSFQVVFRATEQAVFSEGMNVSMGGNMCNVTAVSADGSWLLIRTPPSAAMCNGDVDCGYVITALSTPPSQLQESLGSVLMCPPFCASEVSGAVPLPVDDAANGGSGTSSGAVFAVGSACAAGTAPPVILATASSVSGGGFYYASACASSGMFTDPTTGACSNASDPAARGCAFGSGDSCVVCPARALCPGGSRMWPLPGAWVSSERSGVVDVCPPPALSRCVCVGAMLSFAYLQV